MRGPVRHAGQAQRPHAAMPLLGFQLSGDSRSGAPHGWKHFELD
jgi:hypothetical protein